jgi:hypothetical protein
MRQAVLVTVAVAGLGCGTPKEFISREGRFSVRTPVTFAESSHTSDMPAGQVSLHTFAATRGKSAYMVAYSDLPETMVAAGNPFLQLEMGRDGAVKASGGTLVSDKAIFLAFASTS